MMQKLNKQLAALFVLFIILNTADFVTTHLFLALDKGVETNRIVISFTENGLQWLISLIKLIGIPLIVYFLVLRAVIREQERNDLQADERRMAIVVMVLSCIFYGYVVVNNVLILLR